MCKYESDDSLDIDLESGFRFTYGISDKIEAGCYMPLDFSSISLSSKINFLNTNYLGLAGLAGINFPLTGETISLINDSYNCTPLLATGLAVSSHILDDLDIKNEGSNSKERPPIDSAL